jgi:ABC-2 type transport system ATP-binding protein
VNAVEVRGLRKTYGDVRALDGVELDVPEGAIFGFLGPNGAGKTTTLRILSGLARPTSGAASVFGRDVVRASNDVRALIGFLPDVPGYYGWMTAREFLTFAGNLFGLSGADLNARVDALLDLSGLAGVTTRIGGYSRGMRQRLGVAQALVNSPRLLLLDEPTSALDPMGRKDVLEMVAALRGQTTVFFSTHILTDVERVCDTVAVLHRGRVVRQAPISEIKGGRGAHRLVVEVESGAEELARSLSNAPWVVEQSVDGCTAHFVVSDVESARRAVPEAIAAKDLGLVRFADEEPTLEDVFVDLVSGGS